MFIYQSKSVLFLKFVIFKIGRALSKQIKISETNDDYFFKNQDHLKNIFVLIFLCWNT